MTIAEWNRRRAELKKGLSAAYQARDFETHRRLTAESLEHDALRPAIEAQTARIREENRAKDAALKAAAKLDRIERREAELAALQRLMTRKTGVNVGHPTG